jgi:hypothetical protein
MHDGLSGVALQIYERSKYGLLNYTTPVGSVTSGFYWSGSERICHAPLARAEASQTAVKTVRAVCMPCGHAFLFRPQIRGIKFSVFLLVRPCTVVDWNGSFG